MTTAPPSGDPRPRQILAAVGRTYGRVWSEVDRLRALRDRDFPEWPDWCFLPLQAAHAIVGGSSGTLPPELAMHVGIVGALATWRVSQGIYRFAPAVADAVAETPLDGDLPVDLLYRLPEWCVYIETPGRTFDDRSLHGFWAHLDWELDGGADELRLLLDVARTPDEALDPRHGLVPVPVILGEGTLADALERVVESGRRRAQALGFAADLGGRDELQRHVAQITPLVALVLYLCAENAEIGDGSRRPSRPQPKRTKRGPRLFPPDRATGWDVGVRLGAALRRVPEAEEPGSAEQSQSGRASPRPHIRRAHWHTFRVGAGRRDRVARWVPPTGVRVEEGAGLPATVREVG